MECAQVGFLFIFFFQLSSTGLFSVIEILGIRLVESCSSYQIPNKKWPSFCPQMHNHSSGKQIYEMHFNFNMQIFEMKSGPENIVYDGNDVTIILYGFINMNNEQWTSREVYTYFFSFVLE